MKKSDFRRTYSKHVRRLSTRHSRDTAMKLAVGGEFEAIGVIERELLIDCGLKKDDYLVDVGCGSGRLAKPLADYLQGRYLGIDIVPKLVDYGRDLVQRPDWRFEVAKGLTIPEKDGEADMVCFFSVITHLLHEQSYKYLEEAKRVLKPGGKIVFSYLEFRCHGHWQVFETSLEAVDSYDKPLNVFISADAIEAWASHLGLTVERIMPAEKPMVLLREPVVFEDGTTKEGQVSLGQSVCVLVKSE